MYHVPIKQHSFNFNTIILPWMAYSCWKQYGPLKHE